MGTLPLWGVLRDHPQLFHLMVSMALFAMGLVVALLSAVDAIVEALCPGSDQCPEALYLSTFKSVVGGASGIFMAPVLGSLSDSYGRKPFLVGSTAIITLPIWVLAVSQSRAAIYCYFVAETLSAAVGGGGAAWLTFFLAYVADIVPDGDGSRLGAFGAVSGVTMLGFVVGPLLAAVLPEKYSFQIASLVCTAATVYMAVLLPESRPSYKILARSQSLARAPSRTWSIPRRPSFPSWLRAMGGPQPVPGAAEADSNSDSVAKGVGMGDGTVAALAAALQAESGLAKEGSEEEGAKRVGEENRQETEEGAAARPQQSSETETAVAVPVAGARGVRGAGPRLMRNRSTVREAVSIFSSSRGLAMLLLIAFFHSLADNGQSNNMFYVFKAKFHWTKASFSVFAAGIGGFAILSQVVVLPLVAPLFSMRTLLITGLLVSATHTMLYGIAWAEWVVYAALSLSTIVALISPTVSGAVAKLAGPNEQGKLQGVVAGVSSLSSVLAPLIINPITALFLSKNAPFNAPGFGIFVAGLFDVLALVLLLLSPEATSPTRLPVVVEGEGEEEEALRQEVSETTPLLP